MTGTKTAERFWTIPNMLSLYRVLVFPYVLWLIISEREGLFAIFITISFLTDILDGYIARKFALQTRVGAKLDAWADTGTYILAFIAIYIFKWQEIRPYSFMLILFAVVLALSYVVVFWKFRGLIGMHTYMFKLTGYLQGAFIISLFVFGFYPLPYYACLTWGTIACIEEIIIILLLKKPETDVKGLYWVLKNRRS